ncbi:PUL domain-containing protein [Jimgerdemannia flammicorona]|uniref:PUL domain-containing protein n=1 Tax=Jimgerdemannia flammicorona TaxID=994334 RepID=A0A433DNG5_9FUNG|nr:PUL domain-containing protein [Jimgerdemannia flammicorona]
MTPPPKPAAIISSSVSTLQTATNLFSLTHHLATNRAVVVFFTSSTCRLSRIIEPDYKRLITEKNDTLRSKGFVIGVKVDTGVVFYAAHNYGIRGTPTFKFFLDGKEFHELKGANTSELKSSLDFLVLKAYPPPPHTLVQSLRHIPSISTAPILFSAIGNLDLLFSKLDAVFKDAGAEIMRDERFILDKVKSLLVQKKEGKSPATDLIVDKWDATVRRLLSIIPLQSHFPLLDLLRLLLLDKRITAFYPSNPLTIIEILQRVNVGNDVATNADGTQNNLPKSLVLMTLRVACNTFWNPALSETHLLSPSPTAHSASLTALLISSLPSTNVQVRQAAASLAFNIAALVARKRRGENIGGVSGNVLTATSWVEDEEWMIEVAVAVVGAIETATEEEIIHRLISALVHLLYLGPQGSQLALLVNVLGLQEIVEAKIKNGIVKDEKMKALCGEFVIMLKSSEESK